ncbi:dentin sialophosphoprotein-like [Sycon ciliatum]|uniref:dentin sialophosphoprotein-like n=1 Tax=Sycon ciliatum TaxID=27933 RepID=UPI0031F6468F
MDISETGQQVTSSSAVMTRHSSGSEQSDPKTKEPPIPANNITSSTSHLQDDSGCSIFGAISYYRRRDTENVVLDEDELSNIEMEAVWDRFSKKLDAERKQAQQLHKKIQSSQSSPQFFRSQPKYRHTFRSRSNNIIAPLSGPSEKTLRRTLTEGWDRSISKTEIPNTTPQNLRRESQTVWEDPGYCLAPSQISANDLQALSSQSTSSGDSACEAAGDLTANPPCAGKSTPESFETTENDTCDSSSAHSDDSNSALPANSHASSKNDTGISSCSSGETRTSASYARPAGAGAAPMRRIQPPCDLAGLPMDSARNIMLYRAWQQMKQTIDEEKKQQQQPQQQRHQQWVKSTERRSIPVHSPGSPHPVHSNSTSSSSAFAGPKEDRAQDNGNVDNKGQVADARSRFSMHNAGMTRSPLTAVKRFLSAPLDNSITSPSPLDSDSADPAKAARSNESMHSNWDTSGSSQPSSAEYSSGKLGSSHSKKLSRSLPSLNVIGIGDRSKGFRKVHAILPVGKHNSNDVTTERNPSEAVREPSAKVSVARKFFLPHSASSIQRPDGHSLRSNSVASVVVPKPRSGFSAIFRTRASPSGSALVDVAEASNTATPCERSSQAPSQPASHHHSGVTQVFKNTFRTIGKSRRKASQMNSTHDHRLAMSSAGCGPPLLVNKPLAKNLVASPLADPIPHRPHSEHVWHDIVTSQRSLPVMSAASPAKAKLVNRSSSIDKDMNLFRVEADDTAMTYSNSPMLDYYGTPVLFSLMSPIHDALQSSCEC